MNYLVPALSTVIVAGCTFGQTKTDGPARTDVVSPIQFTIRNQLGMRTSSDRQSVLKTTKMTEGQIREWVTDETGAKERRSATLYQEGYVEIIDRDSTGQLQYSVADGVATRSSRDRGAVLKTLKMTLEQIKDWAREGSNRVVTLQGKPAVVLTVSSDRGHVFGEKDVLKAAKLDGDGIRNWVEEPAGAKEGRGAILFANGCSEIIWHDVTGALRYSVRNELGSRTSAVRDSVQKTIEMKEDAILAWVTDEKAGREKRAATFYRVGYVEWISRGPDAEPPGLGP